jgi:steroid delta-isomerase-like uncharacterized protein
MLNLFKTLLKTFNMKNKDAFALLLAACLLLGCLYCPAQTGPGSAGMSRANERLVRTWMEDLSRHDTMALAGLYAESAQLYSPNWEGAETGPAGARKVYRRYFSSTPDLTHELTHLIATDSAVVIEYIFHGTFQNPEAGTPAYMQGKKYKLSACTRMDIHDGKIQRQVSYFDQVAFLRQVGFFDQHP